MSAVESDRPSEGVLRLTLREHVLSDALCDGLAAALEGAAADPSVRCVVLGGGPDVFCAGAALEQLERLARGEPVVKEFALPRSVLAFPLPLIAALRGNAVGGGLMLALYCDVLVACETSRYGFNFTDLGFTPGVGATALVPRAVGHSLASEMLFTAKSYRGRELTHTGLFTHVVPKERVDALALDLAARMAEKPRRVLELLKRTLAAPRLAAFDAAVGNEHAMHEECFALPETAARIEAAYLRR
jgi:polyketide biosynthesis enoyl-CoA hydratase PksI